MMLDPRMPLYYFICWLRNILVVDYNGTAKCCVLNFRIRFSNFRLDSPSSSWFPVLKRFASFGVDGSMTARVWKTVEHRCECTDFLQHFEPDINIQSMWSGITEPWLDVFSGHDWISRSDDQIHSCASVPFPCRQRHGEVTLSRKEHQELKRREPDKEMDKENKTKLSSYPKVLELEDQFPSSALLMPTLHPIKCNSLQEHMCMTPYLDYSSVHSWQGIKSDLIPSIWCLKHCTSSSMIAKLQHRS